MCMQCGPTLDHVEEVSSFVFEEESDLRKSLNAKVRHGILTMLSPTGTRAANLLQSSPSALQPPMDYNMWMLNFIAFLQA